MAESTQRKAKQVYQNLWKEMWFRWFMILYVVILSGIIIYAGVEVHYHSKTLSKVTTRIQSVSGINIEANQTDACKRCLNNDVIVRSGIGIEVSPNLTQFPTGITTPCYTSNTDNYYITEPTTLQISSGAPFPKTKILGNLTFSEKVGFHIPQYTQDCSLSLSPATCLPFDTVFCDEANSQGSIYIHRRVDMGTGLDETLYSFCTCILNINLPDPVAASTTFCTEPFKTLSFI